jgi:hypothetical protein
MAKDNQSKTNNESSRKLNYAKKVRNFQQRKEEYDVVRMSKHPKHIVPSRSNDLVKSGNAFLTIASRNEQIMAAKGYVTGKNDDKVVTRNSHVTDDRSYAEVVKTMPRNEKSDDTSGVIWKTCSQKIVSITKKFAVWEGKSADAAVRDKVVIGKEPIANNDTKKIGAPIGTCVTSCANKNVATSKKLVVRGNRSSKSGVLDKTNVDDEPLFSSKVRFEREGNSITNTTSNRNKMGKLSHFNFVIN